MQWGVHLFAAFSDFVLLNLFDRIEPQIKTEPRCVRRDLNVDFLITFLLFSSLEKEVEIFFFFFVSSIYERCRLTLSFLKTAVLLRISWLSFSKLDHFIRNNFLFLVTNGGHQRLLSKFF